HPMMTTTKTRMTAAKAQRRKAQHETENPGPTGPGFFSYGFQLLRSSQGRLDDHDRQLGFPKPDHGDYYPLVVSWDFVLWKLFFL
ncbi:MAG: hypothetical protein O3C59_12730, partial [Proteobacteria bacterium]|nr:hypothetical protein [Pseudomonadota bacterium]